MHAGDVKKLVIAICVHGDVSDYHCDVGGNRRTAKTYHHYIQHHPHGPTKQMRPLTFYIALLHVVVDYARNRRSLYSPPSTCYEQHIAEQTQPKRKLNASEIHKTTSRYKDCHFFKGECGFYLSLLCLICNLRSYSFVGFAVI